MRLRIGTRSLPTYAMDNEPDLWDTTHTDVHPARMGYEDMAANFLEYATAVKAVAPSAEVTGPVASGWTALLYSSLDRGDDNFHTHADCTRHSGDASILWFLKPVHAHDMQAHTRTLDVLDVHYYPQGQGLYGPGVVGDTRVRRLRATRSLWDPQYRDESWIGATKRWTLSAADPKAILAQAGPSTHSNTLTLSLAPSSIVLIRISAR